jgi:ribosomal protein S12 methylthiotransferase
MRYFFDPFGCAKNQVDAELMMASLNGAGWTSLDSPGEADLIIVNSCGFIETAKQESINAVLAWRKQYPEKKILLAGCLAQRYGKELAQSLSEADGFFGNNNVGDLPRTADALMNSDARETNAALGVAALYGDRPLLGFPGSAYVKISEGCNNRCSFCAIPLIRGALRCRTIEDITAECKTLLNRGIRELCLIGQDLASYEGGLKGLMAGLAALPGDFWVRLLYLHPDHFPLDILDVIQADKRFLPYFDIPFQHASPSLLKAMNRRGSGESYLCLLDSIRERLPDAVIRSTFLTGFPGETEDDFAEILDFQERARFDWLGVFTYSREEGTPAYSLKNRPSKKTAAERKALIEERQIPITEELINRFVGRTMDVLVEEELSESIWLGRLFCQAPEVDGAAVIRTAAVDTRLVPGTVVPGAVLARAGFDLEVAV